MDKYQNSENIGREKFKQFLNKNGYKDEDIQFTKGQYDRIDCFFKYKVKDEKEDKIKKEIIGIEIKNRNQSYEHYDTYIMEKQKLDYMDELQNKGITNNCWMVYFFGDNLYIFSYQVIKKLISDEKIKAEGKMLPRSTVEQIGNTTKDTYMLPKQYAKKFTL